MGYDAQVMGYTSLKLSNLWHTHLIVNDDYSIKMCDEFRIVYIQIPTYLMKNTISWYTLHQTTLVPDPVSLDSSPERDLEIPPGCSGMSGTEDR